MKLVTVSLSGLDHFPSETYSCMTCSQLSIHNTGTQSIVQWWIGACMGGHLWLVIMASLYIDQTTPQVAQVPYIRENIRRESFAFWMLAICGKTFTVAFLYRLILLIDDKAMICRKRFVIE